MVYRLIEEGKPLDFEDPKNVLTVNTQAEFDHALEDGWLLSPLHTGPNSHESQLAQMRAKKPSLTEKAKKLLRVE